MEKYEQFFFLKTFIPNFFFFLGNDIVNNIIIFSGNLTYHPNYAIEDETAEIVDGKFLR